VKNAATQTLVTPFLHPLFAHMQREHGLTLVESELDEIRHVFRQLETTAEEQAADRANASGQPRPAADFVNKKGAAPGVAL